MDRDDERLLLALWERAAAHARGWQRDEALLHEAGCAEPSGLGARNAALLALRVRLFGERWPLKAACPECGGVAEFEVDASRLAAQRLPIDETPLIDDDGTALAIRAPGIDDLRAASAAGSARSAADELLRRCAGRADASPALRERIARRMEALDPNAAIGFEIDCPQCAARWRAPLDIGDVLASELRAHAEALLCDVDALARAYGWSERDVLALSPLRRAAYLQLAGAA